MPDPHDAIAQLRRFAENTADPSAAACLAKRIREYLAAQDGTTLEDVLGLTPAPGEDSWRTLERRQRRDAAIRAVRERFMPPVAIDPLPQSLLERFETRAMTDPRLT